MANLNKVLLMGNITRDPELTYLPSQTAAVRFGLAVNRSWTAQDGQKKEETTFVDCDAFGKTAEIIAKYKKKGDPLFIEGRLKLDQWEGQDGSKRSKLKIVVENFQFLNRSGGPQQFDGGDEGGEGGGAPAGGGFQQRQQPRQQQQQPYRAGGRPQPGRGPVQQPQNIDADPPSGAEDDTPPIKDDDIPF